MELLILSAMFLTLTGLCIFEQKLPSIDKSTHGQDRAVSASCYVAFRSAYVQYASFKRLAGHRNSHCLTLRPPVGLIPAGSRKRNEAYWTYAD